MICVAVTRHCDKIFASHFAKRATPQTSNQVFGLTFSTIPPPIDLIGDLQELLESICPFSSESDRLPPQTREAWNQEIYFIFLQIQLAQKMAFKNVVNYRVVA
jgi:hypothetical protein